MSKKKAVIFDMDGVLIDSEPFYLSRFRKFFAAYGKTYTDEIQTLLAGASSQLEFEIVSRFWGEDIPPARLRLMYKEVVEGMCPDYNEILFLDVYEVLDRLQTNGVQLSLASSNGMKTIQRVLAATKLEPYFTHVVSGQMFTHSKPHPEIYLHSMEQLGLTAPDCMAVEDSTYGIQAALAAGMEVAAIKDDRFGFDQAQATYMLSRLRELLPILGL